MCSPVLTSLLIAGEVLINEENVASRLLGRLRTRLTVAETSTWKIIRLYHLLRTRPGDIESSNLTERLACDSIWMPSDSRSIPIRNDEPCLQTNRRGVPFLEFIPTSGLEQRGFHQGIIGMQVPHIVKTIFRSDASLQLSMSSRLTAISTQTTKSTGTPHLGLARAACPPALLSGWRHFSP